MGMFQAPTLLEESVSESSHLNVTERDLEGGASGKRARMNNKLKCFTLNFF